MKPTERREPIGFNNKQPAEFLVQGDNTMAVAIINGRRIAVPDRPTGEQIRQAAGIGSGRRLIKRTREGNYPVKPNDSVEIDSESAFVDAPARVKG